MHSCFDYAKLKGLNETDTLKSIVCVLGYQQMSVKIKHDDWFLRCLSIPHTNDDKCGFIHEIKLQWSRLKKYISEKISKNSGQHTDTSAPHN